jgi:hypothetical protein
VSAWHRDLGLLGRKPMAVTTDTVVGLNSSNCLELLPLANPIETTGASRIRS